MWSLSFLYFVFSLKLSICLPQCEAKKSEFDYLVYSQQWPGTVCREWLKEDPNNTCKFPKQETDWSVHGIWPTIKGTVLPVECSTDPINLTELKSLLAPLNDYWVDVYNLTETYSFWEHEWSKHGTCAESIPQLNGTLKYFQTGLNWQQKYNLSKILDSADIVPRTKYVEENFYNITEIYKTVMSLTNTKPEIECVMDQETNKTFINEIRLCFSKQLDPVNCENVEGLYQIINCSVDQGVYYLTPNINKDIN